MALPTISLLLSLLVMATPVAGSSEKIAPTGLIKCYDEAPALTDATNAEFRASLLQLLGALPSAAAPTGFASLNVTGRDSAFVRGLCFGDAPVPSECIGCLSAAARNLASGCHATTRRAGIWTDGCFVAYADTDYMSPSQDGFRSRVLLGGHVAVPVPDADATGYSDQHDKLVIMADLVALDAAANISAPRMVGTAKETIDLGWPVRVRSTVHVLAQCLRDLTEGGCRMCLADSADSVDWDLDAARGDGGVAAAVVGFNCYLRFEVSSSVVHQELNTSCDAHTGACIKCYDPAPTLNNATNGTAFRASLIQLLDALPSAAAPTGFASLNTTSHDSAFVRGLCFGDDPVPSSECLGCLSAAARDLASGCHPTTRRAGIWTDGCFVAYADTYYTSPSEDGFRSRVLLGGHVAVPVPDAGATEYSYSHPHFVTMAHLVALNATLNISEPWMVSTANDTSDAGWPVRVRSTVHVLAQCVRDRTEAECLKCLMVSADLVHWDLDAARGDGGVAAAVVGFNCYLRFEVSTEVSGVIVVGGPVTALTLLAPLVYLAVLRNWK